MSEKKTEACGRCSMTAVVDVVGEPRDVLGEGRIELEDRELRRVSPHVVALSGLKERLDEVGSRFIYGR
ncbi:hypothetical protein [Natronorarus salvus]|uniref:hypothetical protein n=1 Tax=Natronorarus salvus TaxID=3117733 RepID=UPI002F266D30